MALQIYQSHVNAPNYLAGAEATPVFDLAGAVQRGMAMADQMTLSQQQIQENAQKIRASDILLPLQIQEAQTKVRLADDEMQAFEVTNSADALEAQKNARMAEANAKVKALNDQAEATAHSEDIYKLKTLAKSDPASYFATRDGLLAAVPNNPALRGMIDQLDSQVDETEYADGENKTTQTGSYLRTLYQNKGDLQDFHGTSGMSSEELSALKASTFKQGLANSFVASGKGTADTFNRIYAAQEKLQEAQTLLALKETGFDLSDLSQIEDRINSITTEAKVNNLPVPDNVMNFGTWWKGEGAFVTSVNDNLDKIDQGWTDQLNKAVLNGDARGQAIAQERLAKNQALQKMLVASTVAERHPVLAAATVPVLAAAVAERHPVLAAATFSIGDTGGLKTLIPIQSLFNLFNYGVSGREDVEKIQTIYREFQDARSNNDNEALAAAQSDLRQFLMDRASKETVGTLLAAAQATQRNSLASTANLLQQYLGASVTSPQQAAGALPVAGGSTGLPVLTPQQAAQLPSGTFYKGTDGQTYRRP